MSDELSKIDWKSFGYPNLNYQLRKLLTSTGEETDAVYDILFYHRLHESRAITPYLVPYFIHLLRIPTVADKDLLLGAIRDWIYTSGGYPKTLEQSDYTKNLIALIRDATDTYTHIRDHHEDEETRDAAEEVFTLLNDSKK